MAVKGLLFSLHAFVHLFIASLFIIVYMFSDLQFGLTYHDEESHELDEIPIEDLDKYYLLYGSKEQPPMMAASLAVPESSSPLPPHIGC